MILPRNPGQTPSTYLALVIPNKCYCYNPKTQLQHPHPHSQKRTIHSFIHSKT